MNIILVITIGAILLAIAVFLYKKFGSKNTQKIIHAPIDPAEQAAYTATKHKDEQKKLSLKERLELSWKFLYEITEAILSKFSKQDQKEVKVVGGILAKNGMKYNHVVDLAIAPLLGKAKTPEIEHEKQHSEGRAV
jgi:Protein of unknown function (DUF2660)